MNNLKNKIFLVIGMLFIFLLLLSNENYAANATISCAATSETNKNITINVSGSAVQWNLKLMVDGQVIAKSSELENYESNINISFSGVYTPTTAGTKTISIVGSITDINGTTIDSFQTKTITVSAPAPVTPTEPTKPTTPSNNTTTKPNTNNTTTTTKKSDNSNLSGLQVAEGTISPEFNKRVKEYTISVSNDVTKLSIAATPEHSKGTVRIKGNDELQIGENIIEIIVTAEDESTDKYTIKATRADKELSLASLNISFINEEGNNIALPIEPEFSFDKYEYTLEKLSYKIKNLNISAIANKENAKIEILGNEDLKTGRNEITIKVTLPNEDGLEEQKIYTIVLEREEEPVIVPLTTTQKIKSWFSGIGATVGNWTYTNLKQIITGMLVFATVAFVGLTIYLAVDYKKYQKLLSKLAEYNMDNLKERANVALNPDMAINTEKENNENEENIENIEENDNMPETENLIEKYEKPSKGRRFK